MERVVEKRNVERRGGGLEAEFLRVNGNPPVCLQTSETGSEGSAYAESGHALSYGLSATVRKSLRVDGRNKAALSFVSTIQPRGDYNASVLIKTDRPSRLADRIGWDRACMRAVKKYISETKIWTFRARRTRARSPAVYKSSVFLIRRVHRRC